VSRLKWLAAGTSFSGRFCQLPLRLWLALGLSKPISPRPVRTVKLCSLRSFARFFFFYLGSPGSNPASLGLCPPVPLFSIPPVALPPSSSFIYHWKNPSPVRELVSVSSSQGLPPVFVAPPLRIVSTRISIFFFHPSRTCDPVFFFLSCFFFFTTLMLSFQGFLSNLPDVCCSAIPPPRVPFFLGFPLSSFVFSAPWATALVAGHRAIFFSFPLWLIRGVLPPELLSPLLFFSS